MRKVLNIKYINLNEETYERMGILKNIKLIYIGGSIKYSLYKAIHWA